MYMESYIIHDFIYPRYSKVTLTHTANPSPHTARKTQNTIYHLPTLPNRIRQNISHNLPMLQYPPILILMQPPRLLRNQHRSPTLLNVSKPRRIELVLRHQVCLAGLAAQVISRHGVPEAQRGGGALFAEEDHVGEVLVVLWSGFFAEDTAGWEDGLDGADG